MAPATAQATATTNQPQKIKKSVDRPVVYDRARYAALHKELLATSKESPKYAQLAQELRDIAFAEL